MSRKFNFDYLFLLLRKYNINLKQKYYQIVWGLKISLKCFNYIMSTRVGLKCLLWCFVWSITLISYHRNIPSTCDRPIRNSQIIQNRAKSIIPIYFSLLFKDYDKIDCNECECQVLAEMKRPFYQFMIKKLSNDLVMKMYHHQRMLLVWALKHSKEKSHLYWTLI